jgi:hypothetical protein
METSLRFFLAPSPEFLKELVFLKSFSWLCVLFFLPYQNLKPHMKRMMLFSLITLLAQVSFAQSGKFSVSVSKIEVPVGEVFELSYTIENIEGKFELPELDAFEVGGPNHSTMMSVSIGRVSRSQTYTYYLSPKSEGSFEIGPGRLITDSDVIETETIIIRATPSTGKNMEPGRRFNERHKPEPEKSKPSRQVIKL